MVVNMIKWRPWLPLQSKKYEVKIMVNSIKGLQPIDDDDDENIKGVDFDGLSKLKLEIKWKGCKNNGFMPLKRKSLRKDFSKEVGLSQNGVIQLDDEFKRICEFYGSKDEILGDFLPWEIVFLVFYSSKKQTNKMAPLTTPAVVNLSQFVSLGDTKEFDINLPLSILHRRFKCSPSVCISLSLTELRTTQELSAELQRPITMFAPLSPCFGAPALINKDEASSFKSSIRKVKSLTDFVSSTRLRKSYLGEGSSDGKFSTGSENSGYNSPFDTDSLNDTDQDESEENKQDADVQNFCNYGTLFQANLAGGAPDLRNDREGDNLVYYSRHKRHVESSPSHDFGTSVSTQMQKQSPKFGFSWTKGKLSFKSRKGKGEPLLKKGYVDGGDDIDIYRRQFSSDESLMFEGSMGSGSSFISEFGDDNFAVGSWEHKEVLSRDGSLKLQTEIFFASIDQRSERAAGESACTALVAVMADWFHSNIGEMPIKSELDSLIREGSLQWRKLCDNEEYREKFADKHFDLETVIQAQIRPLSVVPERSFIGFFHPDGLDEECFSFLQGAMTFDNIWDEISRVASELNCNSEPLVYVVSWNDHFFIVKVDWDAYYIIDTLGERLFEGCNQAYVLKFNRDTTIEKLPCQTQSKDEKTSEMSSKLVKASSKDEKTSETSSKLVKASSLKGQQEASVDDQVLEETEAEEKVVCRGKECCKEYIKSFLAAIPIRELQIDMKKGLMSSTPLHHRLQIEFNLTTKLQFFPIPSEYMASEMVDDIPAPATADVQELVEVDVPTPIMVADSEATKPSVVADVPASMITVVA